MLSRALSLATVALLIGCFAAGTARAQATNLEAGKSPSQIFAGTCTACHKSPRGLLKSVPASSLPGFLRQHYTTSSDMASILAAYLVSNGATDTRYQAKQDQAKQGKDARQEAARPAGQPDQLDRFGRKQRPAAPAPEAAGDAERAATPDASGLTPLGEGGRAGRSGRRLARPSDTPDATAPGQVAADSKSGARRKLSKRGKGDEELPKPDAAKPGAAKEETAKGEAPKDDASPGKTEADKTEAAKTDAEKADKTETTKSDPAKGEGDKPAEGAKPVSEGRSEAAKFDAPRQNGSGEPTPLRPDPVPPVTPAASATAAGRPEPSTSPSAAAPPAAAPEPPPVTASAPPPLAPAGPPIPPISQ
ncbi:MAG: hypothetical protein ACJ8FZ_01370 [Bradyrhizobium sp.]